jgi:hypothetical protein
MTIIDARQGFAAGVDRSAEPWRPWAGDPTPLSGDSPLVREANALHADWQKRVEYLDAAQGAPGDAERGIIALHQSYLAEIERAAQVGEASTVANDLRAKRDAAERDARATAWGESIAAAQRAVDDAEGRYVAFFEQHWRELHNERAAAAQKLAGEYVTANEELWRKLAPIQEAWGRIWEDSRKTVGYISGFSRADMPALGEYATPPLPSVESVARHGVTSDPAPAKTRPVEAAAA